jgi:hypothetical protein
MSPADIVEKVKRCGVRLALNSAGTGLSLSADSTPPQEIINLVRDSRDVLVSYLQQAHAVRAWIDDNLTVSNPGVCMHCGGPWLDDDESIFLVKDGFVHEPCSAAWEAEQERRARRALGFA